MPATRKTRAQHKAAKETSKEQDTNAEEEEDVQQSRRGRATRSTQKVTSKNEKTVDDEDEEDEENESTKESDETSDDRTRTRRTRRGKMDKEASSSAEKNEDDDKGDAESEQQEKSFNKSTKKVGKQKSAPAKRSSTPTKDISETESIEARPETRKIRASRSRKSLDSKDETVKKDTSKTEDDVEEKEEEKTEKGDGDSENESDSRVRRASRSKTRKSQIPEEKFGAKEEAAKEEQSAPAAEGENTDEAATGMDKTEPTNASRRKAKTGAPSTEGKITDETATGKEKSNPYSTTRPKAKTGESKRKSADTKKQEEEEVSKNQKNTKQLKLFDFLKPKADANNEKADNENASGKVVDIKSDTERGSEKSHEGVQETEHEKELGSATLPTEKQNDAFSEEASIEDMVEDRQLKHGKSVQLGVETQNAFKFQEDSKAGEIDVKGANGISDEKDQTAEMNTADAKVDDDAMDVEHIFGSVEATTPEATKSTVADSSDGDEVVVEEDAKVTEDLDQSPASGVEDSSKMKISEVDEKRMEDVVVKGTDVNNGEKSSLTTGAVQHADDVEKVKNPFNEKANNHNGQQKPLSREDKMDFEATALSADIGITTAVTKITVGLFHAGDNEIVAKPAAAGDVENDRLAELPKESKSESESSELIQVDGNSVVLPQSVAAGVLVLGEMKDDSIHNVEISLQEPSGVHATPLTQCSHGIESIIVSDSTDKHILRASADQPSTTIHVGVSGLSETATVPVEIALELAASSTECATQGQVTVAQDTYESTDNRKSFKKNETDATGVGNKRSPVSDDEELDSACQKRQRLDDEVSSSEVEVPKRYLNLRGLKMRLYSIGIRAHGQVGYEKLFRDYWNAIALYLDSRLSMNYSKACKMVIYRFLRTKPLRRLHNKLILALIDRSLDDRIPSDLVDLQAVPDDVRARIRPIARRRNKQDYGQLANDSKKLEIDLKYAISAPSRPAQYAPLITFPSKAHLKTQSTVRNSATIPGALTIDPYMRRNAQSLGMMVSEDAIWLVTIAMKEYTSQLLRNLVASSKMLNQGQVPPISVNRLTPATRKDQESLEDRRLSNDASSGVQRLSAFDVHLFTVGMPIGPVGAMGGYSSRLTYERSLASCVGDAYTSADFNDLKDFITSSLEASIVVRKISDRRSPASVSPGADRRSPYGGLGRGAKDLATLKARASNKNQQPQPHANSSLSQNQVVQQPQHIGQPQQHQQQPLVQQQRPSFNQQQPAVTEQQQKYTAQQQQLQRQMMQHRLQQSQQHALAQAQQYVPTDSNPKGNANAPKSSPSKNAQHRQSSPPQLQPQPSNLVRHSSQQLQPVLSQPQPSQLIRQSSQQMQPSPPKLQTQPSQLMHQSSQNLAMQGQPIPSPQQYAQPAMPGQPMSPQQMQMQLQMQQQMMQQQQRDPQLQGQMPPQQLQHQQMQMQMHQQMMQMQYMQAMQAQAQKQQSSTAHSTQPAPQALPQPAKLQPPPMKASPPQQTSATSSSPQHSQQPARPPSATGGKGFGIKNLKAMLARSVSAPDEDNAATDSKETALEDPVNLSTPSDGEYKTT
ncbi:hypothetical protein FisN_9Lh049 [Fistulifera solaris]|uniref:Uncharacterized protein n=1 Tax=Fistulifera solaris TaxID=1519565 RepID=A0A1Z5KKD6_FISSO|nr:hypothetical protein FisN_9Lh049 [Fistulifera solaris]|eukprot:GAX26784.1 hypothetical protein FisN_9Lh049 [Fistulifera solaris]